QNGVGRHAGPHDAALAVPDDVDRFVRWDVQLAQCLGDRDLHVRPLPGDTEEVGLHVHGVRSAGAERGAGARDVDGPPVLTAGGGGALDLDGCVAAAAVDVPVDLVDMA